MTEQELMDTKQIFTDALAEKLSPNSGKKYRPSCGTEGHLFMNAWCLKCSKWDGGNCHIALATCAFDVDDPEYPNQWQYNENGQPICLEFV